MIPSYVLTFQKFFQSPNLLCVFSTRNGGVSSPPYQTMNLGLNTGDSKEDVISNRNRFFEYVGIKESQIAFTDQIHSTNVKMTIQSGIYKHTDAIITDRPNLFLAIQTADCFPIFAFHPRKKIVAAIHAGWRGAQRGIVDKTVSQIQTQFNLDLSELLVVIGPGLQKECFEVENDVYDLFDNKYVLRTGKENKRLLNLEAYLIDTLKKQGVPSQNIHSTGICTKCCADEYYSFRRDKNESGRMMGIIGLFASD
jgi:polyphenol oxidase